MSKQDALREAAEPKVVAKIVYSDWKNSSTIEWLVDDLDAGSELITLQSHREAMAEAERLHEISLSEYREQCLVNSRAIAKKDAALKACVEAFAEILRVHANDNNRPKAFRIAADAITQAQEAMK